MKKYKLTVLAPPEATQVLNQVGIAFENYKGSRPLEIGSIAEMQELGDRMVSESDGNTIVLATYTELTLGDRKYGIPADKDEAKEMLLNLSGKTHIYTKRLCIGGAGEPVEVVETQTKVTLKSFLPWEIDGYLSFWDYNYPGAYSPMGKGAFYVRSVMGDFNVIKGMPVSVVCEILEKKYGINPIMTERK